MSLKAHKIAKAKGDADPSVLDVLKLIANVAATGHGCDGLSNAASIANAPAELDKIHTAGPKPRGDTMTNEENRGKDRDI